MLSSGETVVLQRVEKIAVQGQGPQATYLTTTAHPERGKLRPGRVGKLSLGKVQLDEGHSSSKLIDCPKAPEAKAL